MTPFGGIRLGRLAGIPFFINPSWFFVFTLVTYSLATGRLPEMLPGEESWIYWVLGLLVSLLFFASLLAHELGHSLVSQAYRIPVRSITLHLFGGVAQLGREVRRAREEFWIALAGPAVSVALFGLFLGGALLLSDPLPRLGVGMELLAFLNIGVAVFNMVPGFPLDGGRVLRALVWGLTGNYRRATWVAAVGGRLIGLSMIMLGIYLALALNDLSSLWLALIGWFLVSLARQSYVQAVIQDRLMQASVADSATTLIAVPGHLTLDELFAGYIRTTGRQYYLVEVNDHPAGILTPHSFARVPQQLWTVTPLLSAMTPLGELRGIDATASALTAMQEMDEHSAELLVVYEQGRPKGVLTRERLLQLLIRPRRVF